MRRRILNISKKILKTSIDLLKENARKNIQFHKLDFGLYWPLSNDSWLFNSASSVNYTK